MTRPLVAAVLAMIGTATGGLLEEHTVDIKTVAAVGGIVLGGTWALSRRFTRIEDKLEVHENLLLHLACMRSMTKEELAECRARKTKDK